MCRVTGQKNAARRSDGAGIHDAAAVAADQKTERENDSAVNDWWGLSSGLVNVELAEDLPDGMKMLAQYLETGIISGTLDPFACPIRAQNGEIINDGSRRFTSEELMKIDWLCDNIDGEIPPFDALIPQSRNLVRLLGVYRETIPPETEEQNE